jgi:YD repeat-containing protein
MTDGSGSVSYTYDNQNQLTNTSRGSDTFTYTYDPAGDITSRTYPDSTTTTYTYDHDNRLATTATGGNTTSYAYDPASEFTTTTLPSSNGYTETRTYDKAGRLTEVKNATSSATLSDFTRTLDAVGNPTQIVRTGGTSETVQILPRCRPGPHCRQAADICDRLSLRRDPRSALGERRRCCPTASLCCKPFRWANRCTRQR